MIKKIIEERLATYKDPYLQEDFLAAKAVKEININAHEVKINLVLGYPCNTIKDNIINELKKILLPVLPNLTLSVQVTQHIEAHTNRSQLPALPNVKNIIAVGSGKGGVGKSTVAVNLALALARDARVGILDADIYGPSQPTMLGASEQKPEVHDRTLMPVERFGLQTMSIGYLVAAQTAMVWRGPMLGKALQQLFQDTQWDNLDYLVIDLPPGTGDIQLTMCQKIPVSGALLVTTPQDLALLDVRRASEMFKKLNVPLLGVVENMSHYQCEACGHTANIFGAGGADKLAQEFAMSTLAYIPLDTQIRALTDSGIPPVIADARSAVSQIFIELARKVGARLALQPKDYSSKFPKIVVEHKNKVG